MDHPDFNVLTESFSGSHASLSKSLQAIHEAIGLRYPYIDRVAIALYEPHTDLLKTFISSNKDDQKLVRYEARLKDVPSLLSLATSHQSRIISDIPATLCTPTTHTNWLKEHDYRSSLTVPIYRANKLSAFLFFDSKVAHSFDAESARFLEVFADLISQLFLLQINQIHSLVGTVQVASGLARIRDLETGQHLERMANYARLMAQALAHTYELDDEFIEYLYLFAPLHDIGKVGIPDSVLLKPGKLDAAEWDIMRRHVEIGVTITKKIIADMDLEDSVITRIMHNIVAYHHERGDGKGYPYGMQLEQIPIEARIVAVADVYDALSNKRPYKEPWREEEIVAELRKEAGLRRLDSQCVEALIAAKEQRLAIQVQFADKID